MCNLHLKKDKTKYVENIYRNNLYTLNQLVALSIACLFAKAGETLTLLYTNEMHHRIPLIKTSKKKYILPL